MVPYSNRKRNKAQVNLGGNGLISYLRKEWNISVIFPELVQPSPGSPAAHGRELQLLHYNSQQKPPENALKRGFRRMWTIWTVSEYLADFPSWSTEAEKSGPVSSELQSKVTQDGKNHFWCLEPAFLLVYGADQRDLMSWQMITDAAALLEISEVSIMTAWVTDLIDPLPGRSQLD